MRLRTFFPVVIVLSTIGFVTTDVYLPSMPSIRFALDTSNTFVQLTLTFYLITFSLSQLFYGPLSDRLGRKGVVLFGLTFSLLGTTLCIFAPSILILLIGRVLQGLGLGASAALARAIVRDIYSGDELAHFGSYISVGSSVSMAAAPAIGGYLQHYFEWRSSFVFILIYTLIAIVLTSTWLPETKKERNLRALHPKHFFASYKLLLTSPIFLGYASCGALAFGGITAYFAMGPFLLEDIAGLSPVQFGWLALIIAAGLCSGGFFNGHFVRQIGRHRLLVLGILLMGVSGVIMLLFHHITAFTIMLPMFIYMFGSAMAFANAFAGAFHPFGRISGFVGALYGGFQIAGGVLCTGAMALAPEHNQIPLAITLIMIGILTFALQAMAYNASHKRLD